MRPGQPATSVKGAGDDPAVRILLSSLRALLALSALMTEREDEEEIVRLAMEVVPSLGDCHSEGAYLDGAWLATPGAARAAVGLEEHLQARGAGGGPVDIPTVLWAWAYPLASPGGPSGHLLVGAADEPPEDVQFLFRTLAQQTGVALANARLHAREREAAAKLRVANFALERRVEIHQRLTQVVTAGEGQAGIARAVHELTGYPVAIEDRWGTLRAWAGPDRPEPYPRDSPRQREGLVHRLRRAGHPVRHGDRLLVVASPGEDVVGVLALVDPEQSASDREEVALEHGATVLAMELARLQGREETELRQRCDFVEGLLSGDDEETAYNRAQSIGYDLRRPHRVVVIQDEGDAPPGEALFHSLRRAARDLEIGSLLVARGTEVVLLADRDGSWDQFYAAVDVSACTGPCRMGVGGICDRPRDFARSHREAQLAIKMRQATRDGQAVTHYDDLGVYQVLSELPDVASVERFARRWLGALLDHDAQKGSNLVATLSGYLDSGGHYDTAAKLLAVHRSTLKYRLQRIRTVTDHDLSDPDIAFNLHLATRAWQTLEALRGT